MMTLNELIIKFKKYKNMYFVDGCSSKEIEQDEIYSDFNLF